MAPEQATAQATAASDWYSFGLMLHEALTGRHPFRGTHHEMPWARPTQIPPVHLEKPGIPDDLGELCTDLLRAAPAERPSGADVQRRLAGADQSVPPPREAPPFFGRHEDLANLTQAFDAMCAGRTVIVHLHGASGVGKSALAEQFLKGLRGAPHTAGVVVLSGRCYERESVPYKALDGLVDALGRYWRRLPSEQARELLPRDVGPLVRIFPVLLRVDAVAEAPRREAPDPHEVRRRAFAALREVLGRVGDRRPLVLHLDDLQWGDVDSAQMLAELLRPPEPPRLLLIAGFRSEDRDKSPFLTSLASALDPALDQHEIALAPLNPDDARALAGRLLGDDRSTMAEIVARESGGNPFFVSEMVQAVRAGETKITLDRVIEARVHALLPEQRRLLEVVAVAGRPIRHSAALRAAGLGESGRRILIELQAARLLRGGAAANQDVETYHDRIRETVVAALASDPSREALRRHHRRLARALEDAGRADPEVLAIHFHGAGHRRRAGAYYARAARQAVRALAFDRAAQLYRLALELRPLSAERTSPLLRRLGAALANAGRGAEAAQAFLDAVRGAKPGETLNLHRRASDQLLRSGRIAKGLDLLRTVLARVGLSLPATPWRAALVLARRRLRIWWRGTSFRERPAEQVSADELLRIDICWGAASVLSLVDSIRGWAFLATHMLLALRAGEPKRVMLALLTEAVYHAVDTTNSPRTEELMQSACALLPRIEQRARPYHRAMATLMAGAAATLQGRWRDACRLSARAQRQLRQKCTGVAWELGCSYHYYFTALMFAGRFRRCARELPAVLRDARERGDRMTATTLAIHAGLLDLADGAPARARQVVAEALAEWGSEGFHLQHYHALYILARIDLYVGANRDARQRVQAQWPALRRSRLLYIQHVRIQMHGLHADCALAVAAELLGQDSARVEFARLLRDAERDARRLETERTPWATATSRLIHARLTLLRGNRAEALRLFELAQAELNAAQMPLYALAAQRRHGQLLATETGRALIHEADAQIARRGVREPARLAEMLVPGTAPLPG
jgi:hypothetical protein